MPPLPPIPAHVRFSRAQLEVLECLANGKGYGETAEWLGIEEATVRVHVYRICEKLPEAIGLQPLHRVMHFLWECSLLAREETKKAA